MMKTLKYSAADICYVYEISKQNSVSISPVERTVVALCRS